MEKNADAGFWKAHSATAHIPVILKRDPSLAEGNVVLRITFRENANFKTGYPEFSTYTLTVSDRLSKPNAWDLASLDYYFGEYGEKKHELMMKWTEKSWDDEYINSLFADTVFQEHGYHSFSEIYHGKCFRA